MKKNFWPIAIVTLLVACVAANVALFVVASSDPSFAVEPNYYQKAIEWDQTQRRVAASRELGWQVDVRAVRDQVEVSLHDRAGRPLSGASLEIESFHNARSADRRGWQFPATDAFGLTRANVGALRPGLWELRITAQHHGQQYQATLQQDLGLE
jgi:hypothetical protein